jgi:hypothetical protein
MVVSSNLGHYTFINPDGHEYLTPEETAALEDYKEKMTAAAAPGTFVAIYWTPEKAQELLALAYKSSTMTEHTVK